MSLKKNNKKHTTRGEDNIGGSVEDPEIEGAVI